MNNTEAKELARGLSGMALREPNDAMSKVAAAVVDLQFKQAAIDLQQIISSPYTQNALLGAGAGGLIGALQGKKKRRAMLDYALMGGLGGLGATAAKEMLLKPATPPPAVAAAKYDNNPVGAATGLAAAGAGAYGGRQVANAIDSHGKLNRLLGADSAIAKQLQPTIDSLRSTNGATKITENLTDHLRAAQLAGNPSLATRLQSLARGNDHMPRDVGLHLENAGMTTPASVAGRVQSARGAARGNFLGGLFGRNTDDVANSMAAIAAEPASGVGRAGRGLTGSQLQQALRRLPRRGGALVGLGLPVLGALAGPALLNSFSSGAAAGE
jgi:hypothetical protein